MAQKYVKEEDAAELKRLADEAGVRESEVLTALIWRYGAQGTAAAVEAKQASERALRGADPVELAALARIAE